MSGRDELDEVFGDLSAFTSAPSVGPKLDDLAFGELYQLEKDEGPSVDELIVGEEYVTYLLGASGRDLDEFSVAAHDDEVEITAGDLRVKKRLGVRVDGDDVRAELRGGVFSVKLRRTGERDGGA